MFISIPLNSEVAALIKNSYRTHAGSEVRSPIEDFRGLALKYIKDPKDIDWKLGEIIAKVRQEDCNGCGICVIRCPKGARKIVHLKP